MRHVARVRQTKAVIYTEMTKEELEELPEYSMTVPTGTEPGKMWKCNKNVHNHRKAVWVLGYYYEISDHSRIGIGWREIRIIKDGSTKNATRGARNSSKKGTDSLLGAKDNKIQEKRRTSSEKGSTRRIGEEGPSDLH